MQMVGLCKLFRHIAANHCLFGPLRFSRLLSALQQCLNQNCHWSIANCGISFPNPQQLCIRMSLLWWHEV